MSLFELNSVLGYEPALKEQEWKIAFLEVCYNSLNLKSIDINWNNILKQ